MILMNMVKLALKILVLGLFTILIQSCDKVDDVNLNEPSSLNFSLLEIDTLLSVAKLQASAANANLFALYELGSDAAVDSNSIGYFEYQLFQFGTYRLEVRAYGLSGRYLKSQVIFDFYPEANSIPLDSGYFSSTSYSGYQLIWHDEFDQVGLNTDIWTPEIGDGCPNLCGWGNNELQYYRSENVEVADGVLSIEARKENFGGRSYTSSRIITRDNFSFRYGRVDIRALLPEGQGIWPALWMLGESISQVGWPACGEIDIMEMIGGSGRENEVHGTLHWDEEGHAMAGNCYKLASGTFNQAYHVFSIIWTESSIRWLVNDQEYGLISISSNGMTEFHQKFWFIFNVAVGGSWPGNPNFTTQFPQTLKVDYIRVFQELE